MRRRFERHISMDKMEGMGGSGCQRDKIMGNLAAWLSDICNIDLLRIIGLVPETYLPKP